MLKLFFEVREDVREDGTEGMRLVTENEASVSAGGRVFALRLALANEGDPREHRAKARINLLAPAGVQFRLCESGARDYVPTLPSRSELGGEIVSVAWAVGRRKVRPGDVKVFDLQVWVPEDLLVIPIRANVAVETGGVTDGYSEEILVTRKT